MTFSQRIGKTPIKKFVQKDEIDDNLRNSLWNAITLAYWRRFNNTDCYNSYYPEIEGSNLKSLIFGIWLNFLKEPIDEIPKYFSEVLEQLRNFFYDAEWYEVYDFIEFIAKNGPDDWQEDFISGSNFILERENSAYRFVSGQLLEITSEVEIEAVEFAIEQSSPYFGTRQHLQTALTLLSDREKPDYRNSIKESISAVESLTKAITGNDKATLGAALKMLEAELHPALTKAFSSLYGYTSDTGGIRHALLDEDTVTKADAKFMLVSCSAFVGYLIEKVEVEAP